MEDKIISTQGDLFGFLIGDDVQVDIENKRIIRISSESSERTCVFSVISLKTQMMRLLSYLLEFGLEKEISKEELLYQLWEKNNLSSSNQRLWQTLKELRERLEMVGIPSDFILSSRGRSYQINYTGVKVLFVKSSMDR